MKIDVRKLSRDSEQAVIDNERTIKVNQRRLVENGERSLKIAQRLSLMEGKAAAFSFARGERLANHEDARDLTSALKETKSAISEMQDTLAALKSHRERLTTEIETAKQNLKNAQIDQGDASLIVLSREINDCHNRLALAYPEFLEIFQKRDSISPGEFGFGSTRRPIVTFGNAPGSVLAQNLLKIFIKGEVDKPDPEQAYDAFWFHTTQNAARINNAAQEEYYKSPQAKIDRQNVEDNQLRKQQEGDPVFQAALTRKEKSKALKQAESDEKEARRSGDHEKHMLASAKLLHQERADEMAVQS